MTSQKHGFPGSRGRRSEYTGVRKSILSHVRFLTRKGMDKGQKVLLGLRSSRAPLTSVEKALLSFRQELTPKEAARVRIVVVGQARELGFTVRDQLLPVIREALTNALRHSEAASIEAEIEYLSGRLLATVRDNGIGIDPELLHDGRKPLVGLTDMRERAERIDAQLRLWSKAGVGTEVEISLPV